MVTSASCSSTSANRSKHCTDVHGVVTTSPPEFTSHVGLHVPHVFQEFNPGNVAGDIAAPLRNAEYDVFRLARCLGSPDEGVRQIWEQPTAYRALLTERLLDLQEQGPKEEVIAGERVGPAGSPAAKRRLAQTLLDPTLDAARVRTGSSPFSPHVALSMEPCLLA